MSVRLNPASRTKGVRRRLSWLAALAVLLSFAVGVYGAKKPKVSNAAEEQKRALHALDRVTFGPRPGDVQAVSAMGVDKWIELQLHPEQINDIAMQGRLVGYRTLQMSTRDMLFNFPPNPVAKEVMYGKLPMPRDPYRHAIYTAAIDRLQQQQVQKQNSANAAPQNTSAMLPGSNADQPKMLAPDASQRRQDRQQAHSLVDDLSQLPADARLQRILSLPVAQQRDLTQGIPYEKGQALLAGLSPEQRETVLAINNPVGVINGEVQSAKLLRAVYSDRQLEEVLTDFWFNHFNIFIGKGADHYLLTAYEREVIRQHALGKFKDLLAATAKSPAMLFYLDNWQSEGPDSDAARGVPEHPHAQYPGRMNGPFGPPRGQPLSCAASAAATAQRAEQSAEAPQRPERELCARADGVAHSRCERRLHPA